MGVAVTWAWRSHGRGGHMGVAVTWAWWSHGRGVQTPGPPPPAYDAAMSARRGRFRTGHLGRGHPKGSSRTFSKGRSFVSVID